MKKAKIVASIVLAAALGTTMFAAACGKKEEEPVPEVGKEFKLAEYVHPLDSEFVKEKLLDGEDYGDRDNVHDAFSALTKLDYADVEVLNDSNFAKVKTVTEKDEGPDEVTYGLYDLKAGKEVVSGYDHIEVKPVYGYYNNFKCFALGKIVDEDMEFELMGPDGSIFKGVKLTAAEVHSITISIKNYYRDKDKTEFDFLTMTYTQLDDEGEEVDQVKAFLCYAVDVDGEFTFKVVKNEEDTEDPVPESDYPAGSLLGVKKEPLNEHEEYITDSNWKGVSVSVEGSYAKKYTFYKNDNQISSVELNNGELVGYVGDYMYYYEISSVSSEATEGYNVEYAYGSSVLKSNYKLYRFDFVKNEEPEEVETDYVVVSDYTSLYNYTTKTFDKLLVSAVKKENGIANISRNSREYTLVLDDEFKVSADLSAKGVSVANLIKLKDGRYLTDNLIVDDDLNVVAEIPEGLNVTVWAEKSLLVCEYNEDLGSYGTRATMLVDFDGKVLVEPSTVISWSDYPSSRVGLLEFYGDVAYNPATGKLYSAANPSGIAVDKLVKADEEKGEEVGYALGLIFKYVPVEHEVGEGDDAETVYTYTVSFYDLSGKLIGTIANVAVNTDYGYPELEADVVFGKLFVEGSVYTDVEKGETATGYWLVG